MRNLINFLATYNYWFLFVLLEVTSFILLFQFNNFQHSVYLTSANEVTGRVYEASNALTSYFHLKITNEELIERNLHLEQEVASLTSKLKSLHVDSLAIESTVYRQLANYSLIEAQVVNNSINKADNFITINRGSKDGIRPEMGVVDGKGVIGIVYKVSTNYAWVMSVLNSKSSISCKIIGSDYFGYLRWELGDPTYAYLNDLPRHAEFSLGDTIVTSGYSAVFPEGIIVGVVDDLGESDDGLSYLLKIKLTNDFGKLGSVRVIDNKERDERTLLETE